MIDNDDIPNVTEGLTLIQYAVEGDGCRRISSADNRTVDVVNRQAWEVIEEQMTEARGRVEAGEFSLLYYYMVANQMDPGLLGKYVGIARWRVKRHLRPRIFRGLNNAMLTRYAGLFQISVQDLKEGIFQPAVYDKDAGGPGNRISA